MRPTWQGASEERAENTGVFELAPKGATRFGRDAAAAE
jgi:hypothetical protein